MARQTEPSGSATLVKALLGLLIGGVLFVLLWAGLNFAFGTALDGPIGAFVMEQPCQRFANTRERLTGYSPGTASRGRRSTPSVCHFGSRPVSVVGLTDAMGFTSREGVLIAGGLVGYGVCFVVALLGAVYLVVRSWRLMRGTARPD